MYYVCVSTRTYVCVHEWMCVYVGRHMAKGRICKISLFQVLTFGKVLEGALFIYRTLEIANLLVFKIAGRICSTFFKIVKSFHGKMVQLIDTPPADRSRAHSLMVESLT